MTQHPPHLVDDQGNLQASALIPFCSYMTDMTTLGVSIQNFSFPVCKAFKPTIHQGKLCYDLNMAMVMAARSKRIASESGKDKGIMLIVDPNTERSETGEATLQVRMDTEKHLLNLTPKMKPQVSSFVQINTLVRFGAYKEGSFVLRSLKKTTGTKIFLDAKDTNKGCQKEMEEKCQVEWYIDQGLRECNCKPWGLLSALPNKVS